MGTPVDADAPETFTILTTTPNALMAQLRNRMPVNLEPESARAWLADGGPTLLVPAADGVLTARRVSSCVANTRTTIPPC